MPYEPDPGQDASELQRLAFRAIREVRHTVIRMITAHLQRDVAKSWHGLNFDFTGAAFDVTTRSVAQVLELLSRSYRNRGRNLSPGNRNPGVKHLPGSYRDRRSAPCQETVPKSVPKTAKRPLPGTGKTASDLRSPVTESNRRPSPYHGDALPTELTGPTWRESPAGVGEPTVLLAFWCPGGGREAVSCVPVQLAGLSHVSAMFGPGLSSATLLGPPAPGLR
jgi:hypothetical protein